VQRDLVERARQGDHDAFSVLAGATLGRLEAAAMLILRDPDRADEVVQETMVRCWRDLPTLRDPDRFDASVVTVDGSHEPVHLLDTGGASWRPEVPPDAPTSLTTASPRP
jgi:hypothetical protein